MGLGRGLTAGDTSRKVEHFNYRKRDVCGALMNRDLIENYSGHSEILGQFPPQNARSSTKSWCVEMGIVEQINIEDDHKIVNRSKNTEVERSSLWGNISKKFLEYLARRSLPVKGNSLCNM